MKRPSFLEGAGVALIASILGGGAALVLAPVLGNATALHLVIASVGLGYLLYLLARARARVGRVCILALWALGTGAAMALDSPLVVHALVQLALDFPTIDWALEAAAG